jgi:hypothetical protein
MELAIAVDGAFVPSMYFADLHVSEALSVGKAVRAAVEALYHTEN